MFWLEKLQKRSAVGLAALIADQRAAVCRDLSTAEKLSRYHQSDQDLRHLGTFESPR